MPVNLRQIQDALSHRSLHGWLLYGFRDQNPVATHVAGLSSSGSRRWFLWIPAQGRPRWLIHAIERSTFAHLAPELAGETRTYVSWQELEQGVAWLVAPEDGAGEVRTIAMEYSPRNAVPYVSKVDAGMWELVRDVTGATIVSSGDLVQLVQAVLTPEQLASHRRAAAHCLAVKDEAFRFIARQLMADAPVSEYDVQQFILEQFAARDLDPDHPPIVAVNAHAADPHYAPTAQDHSPIRPGDTVLIDLWARERGDPQACFADITWTAYCGVQVPARVQEVFRAVAEARDAAVAFVQDRLAAGEPVYGYEVDQVSRALIERAGYGPHFIHRTGHSLGPELHYTGVNLDNLETQDRRQLLPGVLVTVEPGIYLPAFDPGSGPVGLGIRSEINCFVHPDRLEVTTLPLQTELLALMDQ